MTTSTMSELSTGEYILTLDINSKRHGIIVVPKSNITDYIAKNAHKNILMQGNTYGDKAAQEMFDYYKQTMRSK